MIENHNRFEGLCALAASGQVYGNELDELSAHLGDCLACRDRIAELAQVGGEIFVAHWSKSNERRIPKGMNARFRERAVREGMRFTDGRRAGSSQVFTGLAVAGLLLALLISLNWRSRVHSVKVNDALAAMHSVRAEPEKEQDDSVQQKRVGATVGHFPRDAARRPVRIAGAHTDVAASGPQLLEAKFNLGSPVMRQRAVRLGLPPAYSEFPPGGSLALSDRTLPTLWLRAGMADLDGLPPEYERNTTGQRVFRFSATVASLISLDFPLRTEAAGSHGTDRNQ